MKNNSLFKQLILCIKPINIFLPIVGYAIGGGFASYIGRSIKVDYFWLGLCIVILFSLCSDYLKCFFNVSELGKKNRSKENLTLKNNLLLLSYTLLTIGAIFSVLLYSKFENEFVLLIFFGLFFLVVISSSIPPLLFILRGYSEIFLSIQTTALAPFFAIFLQIDILHQTLFLITFPAIFLLLAFFLAQSLEKYYEDIKTQNYTLMTKLGWNLGMKLHNYFVLISYVLYGIAAIFGLSGILSYPAWLSLPFAGVQFWEMWRIGEGYKPRWRLLKISSLGSISVLAYFYVFILWLR